MRENEFEHRVQEKMDHFHLRPSGTVWAEVERRIRKEKRRRFIFWWFLLPVVLAGGIGITLWWMNSKADRSIAHTSISSEKKNNISIRSAENKDSIKNSKIPTNHTTDTAISTGITTAEPATVSPQPNDQEPDIKSPHVQNGIKDPGAGISRATTDKISATQQAVKISSTRQSKKKKENQPRDQGAPITDMQSALASGGGNSSKKDKQIPQTAALPPAELPATAPTLPSIVPVSVTGTEPPAATNQTSSSTTINIPVAPIAALPDDTVQRSVVHTILPGTDTANRTMAKLKLPPLNKKYWVLGVHIGRSSLLDGLGSRKENLFANAFQPVTGGSQLYRPSVVNPGISAGISFYKMHTVSKRIQLAFGFGYDYRSTRMKLGQRIDSIRNVTNSLSNNAFVSNYYRPSTQSVSSDYTNQYHFLYVSGLLDWTIIQGRKVKIGWRNEWQLRILAASTMLHYDYSLPGYYKDNTILRKANIFLQSGLTISAGKRLLINPFVEYSPATILKNGNSSSHYGGMGLRILFSLKK